MKLILRQRILSFFDTYDVFDEYGNVIYIVKGQLAWGHCFRIYNAAGTEIGMIRQKIITLLPKFEIYIGGEYKGNVSRQLSLIFPKYNLNFKGWSVTGDFFQWNYKIMDINRKNIAFISKSIFNLTDTYVIDVFDNQDVLEAFMVVVAIDAENCSRNTRSYPRPIIRNSYR